MQIIGPHIINGASAHLDVLRRWQPRLALILDPDADDVRALRAACPQTVVIGRIYRPDGEVSQRILADPDAAARWAHDLALGNRAVRAGLLDYVQIANEVCQFWDGLPALNAFELARMRLAEAAGAYKCALFGFSVGNPDLPEHDRMALWRLVYPAIAQAEKAGHCIAVHQYGAPDMWGPLEKGGADWLLHRLEHQVLPRLPYTRVQFAVTEYGIDGLLLDGIRHANSELGVGVRMASKDMLLVRGAAGPAGWQTFTTAEDYVRQLRNVGQYLAQFSDRVLGYAVFTLGHNAPWASYDIAGEVASQLANAATPQPPSPPTPPPTPGQEANMQIYDKQGAQQTWDWLRQKYNVELLSAPATPAFVLAEVRETEGPATVVVRVADGQARPMSNVLVALAWPDGPVDLTVPAAQAFKSIWRPRAAVQATDGNGYTGYGLGAGSYYDPQVSGGPHTVWILHDQYASDGLAGVGMLPGTEHMGPLRLTFTLAERTPVYPNLPAALRGEAERHDVLPVNPHAALCRAGHAKRLWPTSAEFSVSFAGVTYVGQRFRDPTSDQVHVLYCVQGQWSAVYELVY